MKLHYLLSSAALCLGGAGLIVAFAAGPSQSAPQPGAAGAPIGIVHTSPFGAATSHSPVHGRQYAPLPQHGRRAAAKVGRVDGCQHAYGTPAQCLPTHIPGGAAHACAYLTRGGFFIKPLQVHLDPMHLMAKKHVRMQMSGKVSTISGCTD